MKTEIMETRVTAGSVPLAVIFRAQRAAMRHVIKDLRRRDLMRCVLGLDLQQGLIRDVAEFYAVSPPGWSLGKKFVLFDLGFPLGQGGGSAATAWSRWLPRMRGELSRLGSTAVDKAVAAGRPLYCSVGERLRT